MTVVAEAFTPGIYILKVNDIIEDKTNEGALKIVMSHDIVGMNRKINFDNYVVQDVDGTPREFGIRKLRAFIDAHKLDLEDVTVILLKTLTKDKMFKAKLDVNAKGYPQIHFSDIYPLDYDKEPTLNPLNGQEPPEPEETEDIAKIFTEKTNTAKTETKTDIVSDDDI